MARVDVVGDERDDLDDLIAEEVAKDPGFSHLLAEAEQRHELLRALAQARRDAGLSQTVVAARMGTSTSVVARLEGGSRNTTLGTVQRYATAMGKRLAWQLVADEPASRPEPTNQHAA